MLLPTKTKAHGITKLAALHALTSIYTSLFNASVHETVKSAIAAPDIPHKRSSSELIRRGLPPSSRRMITKALMVQSRYLTQFKRVFSFTVDISLLTNFEDAPFAVFDITARKINKYPITP